MFSKQLIVLVNNLLFYCFSNIVVMVCLAADLQQRSKYIQLDSVYTFFSHVMED